MSILEGATVGISDEGLKASTARKAYPRLEEGVRHTGRIVGAELKVSDKSGNLWFQIKVAIVDDMGQTTNQKTFGNLTLPWITPESVLTGQTPPLPADLQQVTLAKKGREDLGPNTMDFMLAWGRAILGETEVPRNAGYAIKGDKTSGIVYNGQEVESWDVAEALHQERNAKVDAFFQTAGEDTTLLVGYDIDFEIESSYNNATVTTEVAEELVAKSEKVFQGVATGFDNGPRPVGD
jgi:hypothetical protein